MQHIFNLLTIADKKNRLHHTLFLNVADSYKNSKNIPEKGERVQIKNFK